MEAKRAPYIPRDEDDRVADRVDQGVANYDGARYLEGVSDEAPRMYPYARPTTRRRSPRGVAYREPSDSDLDEYWNAPTTPATPEELRILKAGVDGARAAVRLRTESMAQQEGETESERNLRIAQERARRERHEKRLRQGF